MVVSKDQTLARAEQKYRKDEYIHEQVKKILYITKTPSVGHYTEHLMSNG